MMAPLLSAPAIVGNDGSIKPSSSILNARSLSLIATSVRTVPCGKQRNKSIKSTSA